MSKAVYQFKPGAHLRGDAQAVGERLEKLREKGDGVTPEIVVADARKSTSVLHSYFEWDDAKAADKYRLDQAGHLIRSIVVTIEEPAEEVKPFRAFVPVVKACGDRVYETTARALSDAEYRRQILAQAHSELGAIARKYRELQELAEVVGAIDRVGELVGGERLSA